MRDPPGSCQATPPLCRLRGPHHRLPGLLSKGATILEIVSELRFTSTCAASLLFCGRASVGTVNTAPVTRFSAGAVSLPFFRGAVYQQLVSLLARNRVECVQYTTAGDPEGLWLELGLGFGGWNWVLDSSLELSPFPALHSHAVSIAAQQASRKTRQKNFPQSYKVTPRTAISTSKRCVLTRLPYHYMN